MTLSASAPARVIDSQSARLLPKASERIVLATDLDGTFLGGNDGDRRQLYELIDANRDAFTLVFVTGRDLPFIHTLGGQGVPVPDFVIGDVGTSVVDWRSQKPLVEVESWIDSVWNDASAEVRRLLADEPGLQLQEHAGGRRVSYFYDENLRPDLQERVRALGYDCIISGGIYFDVLPKGISKGPTLQRVVEALEFQPEQVVTAGDTLNDLSMLEMPYAGIAMGNSEAALVEAIRSLPNVHHAAREGAGGILEGLVQHGKLLRAAA